ncbi:hypothetical protein [Aureimonas psammosilenae]|uniref:hypothetical protein n=1 Tax=Aureimonas psammosilenae TaxID=2495496 RepID=UPI0012605059|nr:hypothetical protein [Aureimonas psammosilenae]
MISKGELTSEEWDWLLKLYRHDTAFLTTTMADRLLELELAERKLGGVGISSVGKRLVDAEITRRR